jgi:DNA helicase-2/ATP-dependent DNA helicase PcrA
MFPSRFLNEIDKSKLRVIGKKPAAFGLDPRQNNRFTHAGHANRSGQIDRGNAGLPSGQSAKISSDKKWKQGDRVFNDDYGYGAVMDIAESEDGPVVTVRFDNGQQKQFLSLYQSGNFTKMGNDD